MKSQLKILHQDQCHWSFAARYSNWLPSEVPHHFPLGYDFSGGEEVLRREYFQSKSDIYSSCKSWLCDLVWCVCWCWRGSVSKRIIRVRSFMLIYRLTLFNRTCVILRDFFNDFRWQRGLIILNLRGISFSKSLRFIFCLKTWLKTRTSDTAVRSWVLP